MAFYSILVRRRQVGKPSDFDSDIRRFESCRRIQFFKAKDDWRKALGVSLEELKKAVRSLEEAILLHANATPGTRESLAFRDAVIQRFEFCVELSWKVSMKAMGSKTTAAKIAIREMAQNHYIADPQVWFDFIEARNETSHSYDENVARRIFSVAQRLPKEIQSLLTKLEST